MFALPIKDNRWNSPTVYLAPLTWGLGIVAATIACSPALADFLQFDSLAIAGGEFWRFMTGHFVHWNFAHLFWDLSVFMVLGTLCEQRSRSAFLACTLGSAAAISLYLLVAMPEMPLYRGLSGIDTGLFTLLGVVLYADARANDNRDLRWLAAAAMLGLVAKIAYEFASQATIFVDPTSTFTPVPVAHVIGVLVGVAVSVVATHERLGRQH